MKISIIIPAYRDNSIALTVESILHQTHTAWELIAVGQEPESSNRSSRVKSIINNAAAVDDRVRYVHLSEFGATRALNAGIRHADGEIIAIIDDDCEARTDWLATIAQYFTEKPEIGLVGGSLIKPSQKEQRFGVCPSLEVQEIVYDPVACDGNAPEGWDWYSCNVALRREVVEQVGPFDEYLGPGADFPAADDMDYKLRLEALGIKMASTPNLVVYHTHGYRYGLQAIIDHQRNYAYGNGGFAGKLTLLGDPRGPAWVEKEKHDRILRWLRPFRPHQILRGILGRQIFMQGYNHCLANFDVDQHNLLPKYASEPITLETHDNRAYS